MKTESALTIHSYKLVPGYSIIFMQSKRQSEW